MDDTRTRQELLRHRIEARPWHASALTAPIEPLEQEPAGTKYVLAQAPGIATDSKVLEMATDPSTPDALLPAKHPHQRIVRLVGKRVRPVRR